MFLLLKAVHAFANFVDLHFGVFIAADKINSLKTLEEVVND